MIGLVDRAYVNPVGADELTTVSERLLAAELVREKLFHLVGDMAELVKALGETKAVIVGHDWGAPVAWHAALFRPEVKMAEGRVEKSIPNRVTLDETMDIGIDTGTPVADGYDMPFKFTGKLKSVTIDLD
mgnify:CR=1 FL=1